MASYLLEKFLPDNPSSTEVIYGILSEISKNDIEGRHEVITELAKLCPAALNVLDDKGNSLLHTACRVLRSINRRDVEIVRGLVESGIDLDLVNHEGKSAMQIAFEEKKYHLVAYFASTIRSRANMELEDAMKCKDTKGIIESVKKGADCNFFIGDDNLAIVRLGKGLPVMTTDKNAVDIMYSCRIEMTPLHVACAAGDVDCVRFLLDSGAKLSLDKNIIIPQVNYINVYEVAMYAGSLPCLKEMIKDIRPSEINEILIDAVRFADKAAGIDVALKMDFVRVLLEKGADINFSANKWKKSAVDMADRDTKDYLCRYVEEYQLNIGISGDGLADDPIGLAI